MKFRSIGPTPALARDDLVDVYLAMRPLIERVIARRTGSATLAADLAQEMFFKIDSIKVVLVTRADAERYLLRVASNASLDHIKIESRRRAILDEAGQAAPPAIAPSPEAGALAGDQLRLMQEAPSELPEKCRSVFMLSRIHGLSHSEIAAELDQRFGDALHPELARRADSHSRRRAVPDARNSGKHHLSAGRDRP